MEKNFKSCGDFDLSRTVPNVNIHFSYTMSKSSGIIMLTERETYHKSQLYTINKLFIVNLLLGSRAFFQIADAQCECRAGPDGVCRQKYSLVYNQDINGLQCVQDKTAEDNTLQGMP